MAAVLSGATAQLTFVIIILAGAATVTLLLAVVGLYGVLAYIVSIRTRELGIRIALGASPGAVAGAMSRHGMTLAGIGIAIGIVLFALVSRFLRGLLFGVATSDPVTLGAATLMLVAIAALASWVPARRASRIDPVDALRAD